MFVGDKNTTNNVKCKISDKVEYIRRIVEWRHYSTTNHSADHYGVKPYTYKR